MTTYHYHVLLVRSYHVPVKVSVYTYETCKCSIMRVNLIRTSIYDKYSGSMEISTHLYQISHCKTTSGTISGMDGATECLSRILAVMESKKQSILLSSNNLKPKPQT